MRDIFIRHSLGLLCVVFSVGCSTTRIPITIVAEVVDTANYTNGITLSSSCTDAAKDRVCIKKVLFTGNNCGADRLEANKAEVYWNSPQKSGTDSKNVDVFKFHVKKKASCELRFIVEWSTQTTPASGPKCLKGRQYEFRGDLELTDEVRDGESIVIYLSEETVKPNCGWKGEISIDRNSIPMSKLSLRPITEEHLMEKTSCPCRVHVPDKK